MDSPTTSEADTNLEFKHLKDVRNSDIIHLNNNPLVRRQMPLARGYFGETECIGWVDAKEGLWQKYGYGPWAFIIDDRFAGWGGLQYEDGDADLALVLHPDYWGSGKIIYEEIIGRAFGEMRLQSVTVLLPPTRTRVKAILRLGFQLEGEVEISSERFIRYRLNAPHPVTSKIDSR